MRFCCEPFAKAMQYGTNCEAYGAEIQREGDQYVIGIGLPPIEYCPWCSMRVVTQRVDDQHDFHCIVCFENRTWLINNILTYYSSERRCDVRVLVLHNGLGLMVGVDVTNVDWDAYVARAKQGLYLPEPLRRDFVLPR